MASFESLIDAFTAAWCANDPEKIIALFDGADSEVTCLLSDAIDPAIGEKACFEAITKRCTGLGEPTYVPRNILKRDLGSGVAAAFYLLDRTWYGRDGANPAPRLGQRARASVVSRRIDGTWRIAHYAEAPLAPLLELQAYYERVAADGLDAIPPRPWEKT